MSSPGQQFHILKYFRIYVCMCQNIQIQIRLSGVNVTAELKFFFRQPCSLCLDLKTFGSIFTHSRIWFNYIFFKREPFEVWKVDLAVSKSPLSHALAYAQNLVFTDLVVPALLLSFNSAVSTTTMSIDPKVSMTPLSNVFSELNGKYLRKFANIYENNFKM
jgi:hypothetical protein